MTQTRHINWNKVGVHSLIGIGGFLALIFTNFFGGWSGTYQGEELILLEHSGWIWWVFKAYIISIVAPIYINTYFLIPQLWYRYNVYFYFLGLSLMIFLLIHFLGWLDYFPLDFATFSLFFIIIIIQTLFYLTIEGFKYREQLQMTTINQRNMELKLLKNQINPHFLFNALNNLYSLSLFDPKQTPDAILKLSSLMRYSVESSKKNVLQLEEEIQFIQSYIYLERIRLNAKKVQIETQFDVIDKSWQIPPMLLIPFVENAFKHGVGVNGGQIFIKLKIIDQKQLFFMVKNSIKSTDEPYTNSTRTGILNTQRRLALLFPNQHQLDFHNNENFFEVHLKLNL